MIDYTAKDIGMIGNFRFWCQKILPAVYDDSLSYYELLCKVMEHLTKINEELNVHSDAITELQMLYASLKAEFDEFKETGFLDYYAAQLQKWVEDNMPQIVEDFLNIVVFFGLTMDGYFVAYIPESWDEITFDTGADYSSDEYGRLILEYYVDSPHEAQQ